MQFVGCALYAAAGILETVGLISAALGTLSIQLVSLFSVPHLHHPILRKSSIMGYCDGVKSSATKIYCRRNQT